MASDLDIAEADAVGVGRHTQVPRRGGESVPAPFAPSTLLRFDPAHGIPSVVRYPQKLSEEAFYTVAYPLMVLSRCLEERMLELFRKGYVKGTVTVSIGNEGTTVGMSMPLRPGRDVVSLLHRDFAAG